MGKRGASRGNQNARKHGFYSRTLDQAGKLKLQAALDVEGLGEDFAILRVKLRRLVKEHPDRLDLHLAALRAVARLLQVNATLPGGQKKSLKAAIGRVLTEVAVAAGIKVLTTQATPDADSKTANQHRTMAEQTPSGTTENGNKAETTTSNAASIVEIMAENERKRMESGTTPRRSTLSRFLFFTLHVKFESCPAVRGQVGVSRPAPPRV